MSREMKNSGLPSFGIVPKDWKTTKLKNILLIRKEKSFGYGHLLSVYLDRGVISYDDSTGKQVHKPSEDLSNYQRVYINDFVLNNQQAWRGSVGVSKYDGIISPAYYVYQLSSDCIPCYMNYVLRDKCMVQQYEIVSRGVGSIQRNLFIPDFKTISLYLPSPTEQQQIVHFLDRKCTAIDTAIEKTKKSIEKLEEYKKAVITKAVTKGIDPNAKMKDSGVEWIGEIPEGWEVKRLKHAVTKLSKGNGITKDDVVENGDVSCVRYGEIYTQYNYVFDKCKTRTNMGKVSSPQTFSYGDILCAGTGELIDEIGKPIVYIGKELCLAGGDIIVIKHQQDPLFMSFLLNSAYCQGQRSIGKYKLKVVHISAGDIGNIKIALPRLNDQIKIAQFLKEKNELIDGMIKAKINSIMKLEEYKKSLIYYAVTGKIDCRGEEL